MVNSLLQNAHICLSNITRSHTKSVPIHPSGDANPTTTSNIMLPKTPSNATHPLKTPQRFCPKYVSAMYIYSRSSGLFTGDARMGLSTTGLSNRPPLVEILKLFLIKSPVLALPARSCLSGSVLSTGAYSCSTAK